MKQTKFIPFAVLLFASFSSAYASSESMKINTYNGPNTIRVRVLLDGRAVEGATVINKTRTGKVIDTLVTSDSGFAYIPVRQDYTQLVYLDVRHDEHQARFSPRWVKQGGSN